MKMNLQQRALVVNALLAKANDDRYAAVTLEQSPEFLIGATKTPNPTMARLAQTLKDQAQMGEDLAEAIEQEDEDGK